MKKLTLLACLLAFAPLLAVSTGEARMGGGRSFGSRGSRSYAAPSQTYRGATTSGAASAAQPGTNQGWPRQPAPSYPIGGGPGGGGFLRGMAGGLAGGFLGSLLFRSLGYGGMGMPGGGGFGLIEFLVFGGLIFFVARLLMAPRAQAGPVYPHGIEPDFHGPASESPRSADPNAPFLRSRTSDPNAPFLRPRAPEIDPEQFKQLCMDYFFDFQAAWMHRDLAPVRDRLTPEVSARLENDLAALRTQGRINRLENIAVREVQLTESWSDTGTEFVTLRFLANLLDYTVDERTGAIVEGNRDHPVKFEEFWTFCRDTSANGADAWRLSAVDVG